MITTTRKLNPLATSCSTGKVSSSIRCWASFLNHSCSALSALIGPRQNSTSAVAAARTAPTPSIAFRPRMARRAGVPNRPNRNHVMPRTPTHPSRASPRVPTIPNWNPCWASHGVMASISSRYKKSTSNRATANSTSTIETICPMARVLIASFSTWIQAKLPPMMMNRKNHRSTTRAKAEQTPDPAHEHEEEARQAEPVKPRHADRVPPGHEQRRQKASAARAERNGVERDHRAPDARHQHRRREEEQQELPHDLPEGI